MATAFDTLFRNVLASDHALRSLINRVLNLCRLDEIGVPFQDFLST